MLRTMPTRQAYLIAFISLLCFTTLLSANLRKEFQAMQDLYDSGKLNELAGQLITMKPSNDEERAQVSYLNAMLKIKKSEMESFLQQAADKYPRTNYGQIAMVERAKMHIIDREAVPAKTLLSKVTSTDLMERFYWMTVCAEMLDDYAGVITNAENYQRLAPGGEFIEESHYLIADSYINQKKYQSAIATLNKLKTTTGFPTDTQYFHFKLGHAHQLAGQPNESLASFKTGLELNRLTQLAYTIEDHLFELKDKYGSRIDLSFLYPYSELELPEALTPDVTPPAETLPLPFDPPQNVPLKLGAKPTTGFFLQAGRFGVEANASTIAQKIRQMKLPGNYFEDKTTNPCPGSQSADHISHVPKPKTRGSD
jgi:tetratricopeptide (TPR) repeat protein